MDDAQEERLRRAALSGTPLTTEESAQFLQVLHGRTEALHMRAVRELAELLALPEEELTAVRLRRVAELVEIVRDEQAARAWWVRAAEAGDEDARGYLGVLLDEDFER